MHATMNLEVTSPHKKGIDVLVIKGSKHVVEGNKHVKERHLKGIGAT
jgi:hypothetical protein